MNDGLNAAEGPQTRKDPGGCQETQSRVHEASHGGCISLQNKIIRYSIFWAVLAHQNMAKL